MFRTKKPTQVPKRSSLTSAVRSLLRHAQNDAWPRLLVSGYVAVHAATTAHAQELPVPCGAGSCGPSVTAWVTRGTASSTLTGNSLTIDQTSANAVYNWRSFNVGADSSVEFRQPDGTSVALNQIFQADASRIFGSLKANGRVYLVNQNGIIFGEGAEVDVGALLATTLNLRPDALDRGLTVGSTFTPLASRFTDATGQPLESQPLTIEQGARLFADGGQIFLFAPVVENQGRIETPDGQAILAAGQAVYLSSSDDANLRGLVVAVDLEGTVENGDAAANATVTDPTQLVGQIVAERGNVTLAGLTVNQTGRVTATTSVRSGGSVRLVAAQREAQGGGNLTLGSGSRTEVLLDADDETTTVDVNEQPRSNILLAGKRVVLESNSAVVAPSGDIRIKASDEGSGSVLEAPQVFAGDARVLVEEGAVLDVSGSSVVLPMERNMLTVELRGSQLADSPLQRDGALRGQRVQVDTRVSGQREDGTTWYGTPLADLAGDVSTIARTVAERNLAGGNIEMVSQGDILVAAGARHDVSGGQVRYEDGYITPSSVLGADGQIYGIADAASDREYVGVLSASSYVRRHERWGVTRRFSGTFAGGSGTFEPGYVEGKDAGSLSLLAPNVVFDGQLAADRVIGPRQRLPSEDEFAGAYRPANQIPTGGQLLLGQAPVAGLFVLPDVAVRPGLVLPGLLNDAGQPFDARVDALPASVNAVRLRPELFGEGAATHVSIRSDGTVSVPEQTALNLPALSHLDVTARDVDFAGSLRSPGGSVRLEARPTTTQLEFGEGAVRLRDTALLDVSGLWVNDSRVLSQDLPTGSLAIDGGSVALVGVNSDVTLASGSVVDTSGGAHLDRFGSLHAGAGGAISVSASSSSSFADRPAILTLGGELRSFGLESGGSLELRASSICIAPDADTCNSALDSGMVLLDPALFGTGGFSSYAIAANRRELEVADDAELRLRQTNYLLLDDALGAASASSLNGLVSFGVLDDVARHAVDLSLTLDYQQTVDQQFLTAADFAGVPVLSVGSRARIQADPGARVRVESDTAIHMDGAIEAPAGNISLTLNNNLIVAEYLPPQSIWLGQNARLNAAGVSLYRPDDLGLLVGDVRDGGTIALTAERGYIAVDSQAVLDVSGTAAPLDIRVARRDGSVYYERRNVASAAGSMAFTAAEAIFLGGQLRAASGDPATLLGGSLSFGLDARSRLGDYDIVPPVFPPVVSRVALVADSPVLAVGPGLALPPESTGYAELDVEAVEAAGFDNLRVEVATQQMGSGPLFGEVVLGADVALALRGELVIDSPLISSGGGATKLEASVVSLGQRSSSLQLTPSELPEGTGELEVNAGLIELVGNSTLGGFRESALNSTGDIRARGLQFLSERVQKGSLHASGTLSLRAQQVYPSTLSQFVLTADDAIALHSAPGTAAPLYSAGGNLTLQAPRIDHGGVLRAPFGTVLLAGDQVNLLSGSVTATSAAGLAIPFGQTQGGFDWVYRLDSQTLVYGADGETLPSQAVRLEGDSIDVREGAVVDASGGGDLLAFEFVPGVTGTHDVLSPQLRPDAFAIVPVGALRFAPHDTALYEGSSIQPGESVYLSGVPGLPAGVYAMLPARYALLPGAYYVRPVAGYRDLGPDESRVMPDGATLVSGYRAFADTGLALEGRRSGFAVRPGSEVLREARYDVTSANEFFAARAAEDATALARLPRDAGVLSIAAGESLRLDGSLRGTAASGGRGTALDISSDQLRVVGANGAAPETGVVDVDAASIAAFGAESVLLGGRRQQSEDGLGITTLARTVTVTEGAELAVPDLLLVGTERVSVGGGATLRAAGAVSGSSVGDLLLDGDGALLRVTGAADSPIVRSNSAGGVAELVVAAGAQIRAANGSVAAESAGTAQFAPLLELDGGVLALTGDRISLGDPASPVSGLALSSAQLASLDLDGLVLSSRSTIDLYGALSLTAGDLSLRAGALRGFGSGAAQLAAADTLTLEGAVSVLSADPGTGAGSLLLQGGNVVLGDGSLGVSGFDMAALTAADAIELRGDGALAVAGDLSFDAQRLTTASGATRAIDVDGAFAYSGRGAATSPATDAALGARLGITADSVLFAGRAELNSGVLELASTAGDTVLTGNTDLRLGGVLTDFDSVPVGSRGGWLTLESRTGNVIVDAGATIDVSSASANESERGSVSVRAVSGSADLRGTLTGGGADFTVDAGGIADFLGLNARLNTGEFSGDRAIRQRGAGDLVVGAGAEQAVAARSLTMTADGGRVVIDGAVRSHAQGGGAVLLAARDGVAVNGVLDVSAAVAGERNGRIELGTSQGGVSIAGGARVIGTSSVGRDESLADGTLNVRMPRTLLATLADSDVSNDALTFGGDLSRLNGITIEGVTRYDQADGVITAEEVAAAPENPIYAEATDFATQAAAIVTGLGTLNGPAPQVVAGIELTAPGDLTLQSQWQLNDWRFNGLPGRLTLRAAGDLTFAASLTDGFTAASPQLITEMGPSWSYRLSAGADSSSANPLATITAAELSPAGSTLRVNAATAIRTGTGSIELAAARNVELAAATSVIYTAGVATPGVAFAGTFGELGGRQYPDGGGDIRLSAGRDVVGAVTNQLITDWLWRTGRDNPSTVLALAPAWTVNFQQFRQNIGTLGGGDLTVHAGGDVRDLSAVAPSIGRQVGGRQLPDSRVEIVGGGNIDLRAGGNVLGGLVYAGLGSASVTAGNDIGVATGSGLGITVALGDAKAQLSSRGDLTLGTVLNPTLVPGGRSQPGANAFRTFFSTYADDSAVGVASTAGDVRLQNDRARLFASVAGSIFQTAIPAQTFALTTYAPSFSAAALRGDLRLQGSFGLYPTSNGGLELFAFDDLVFDSPDSVEVIVSDADKSALPTVALPRVSDVAFNGVFRGGQRATPGAVADFALFNATVPERLRNGRTDYTPSRLVAKGGDVLMPNRNDGLYVAEPVRIVAGGDIAGLSVRAQNFEDRDVSAVIAGRDVIYPLTRGDTGAINADSAGIVIDGPGTLEVRAGRDLDLQTSSGIRSSGNLLNSALPADGADISVQVGTAAHAPDYVGFVTKYLESAEFAAEFPEAAAEYREQLLEHMRERGMTTSSFEQALAAFKQLPVSDQAPLLESILFGELRASGRAAAEAGLGNGDFTRGFDALTAYFPGANPDVDNGETNSYRGDMRLYFSRIYTLDDGDIRLLAPGGEINAGLASPPTAFNLNKGPQDLGIVAQSEGSVLAVSYNDFLVNESRVFAADGGNILVWATQGDIDAGRGAKTAISAPPPIVTFDAQGAPIVTFPPALTGSGIQTLATSEGRDPGNVDLFAPRGVVNAGDAGIVAGNLTIAATAVLGADNISVSGVSVGVPVDTGGFAAALTGVSAVASSATNAATDTVAPTRDSSADATPLANEALGFLDVFITGFGGEQSEEEACDPAQETCPQ